MKPTMITTLVLLCLLTVGCQEENMGKPPDERLMNSRIMDSYRNIAIQNAIISEHTIFPYHFVRDAAELSELGERDLAVLTAHLARSGGHLNIRQLDTPANLYEARVNLVHERLNGAGIDMARISISDGLPGGSGMPSERVLVILEQETSQSAAAEVSATYGPEMR